MAVAVLATDTWIQHLPFVGGRRPSPYGDVDGVWYGVVSGDGDATGGNVTLNGRLSFDRKEDWVYILGAIDVSVNNAVITPYFTQVNSGPLIPTASAVQNPSFHKGGDSFAVLNNAVSLGQLATGGADNRAGIPIFGDKRIAGIFLMLAAGFGINTDGATYQMSSWGFLIEYSSFFRNRPPAFA